MDGCAPFETLGRVGTAYFDDRYAGSARGTLPLVPLQLLL
jgi:hypothetical protein